MKINEVRKFGFRLPAYLPAVCNGGILSSRPSFVAEITAANLFGWSTTDGQRHRGTELCSLQVPARLLSSELLSTFPRNTSPGKGLVVKG